MSRINDYRIKDSPAAGRNFVSASQNVRQKFRLARASRILSWLAEITSLRASRAKIWQKFSVRATKISGTVSTSSQFFHSHGAYSNYQQTQIFKKSYLGLRIIFFDAVFCLLLYFMRSLIITKHDF